MPSAAAIVTSLRRARFELISGHLHFNFDLCVNQQTPRRRTVNLSKVNFNVETLRTAANNPDYVKSLLGENKNYAIHLLQLLIPFISINNWYVKEMYLKIFPVFFSYSEVFNAEVPEMYKVIDLIMNHRLFLGEKSLFEEWKYRFKRFQSRQFQKFDSSRKLLLTDPPSRNRFRFVSDHLCDTIGYSEIDFFNSFHKYLKHHKLHKYLFFFANLAYVEILSINSENIMAFEEKINIMPMTTGARNAILRKLTDLRFRSSRLFEIQSVCCRWDCDVESLGKFIEMMREVIKTPIRGQTIYAEQLPLQIVETFHVLANAIDQNVQKPRLNRKIFLVAEDFCSVLRKAYACTFFSVHQKEIFNNLRHHITSTVRDVKRRAVVIPLPSLSLPPEKKIGPVDVDMMIKQFLNLKLGNIF